MTRTRAAAIDLLLVAAVSLAAVGIVRAHGASKGLHLHLHPDPAKPGGTIAVTVNAAEPLVELKVGFVGQEPEKSRPAEPRKDLLVSLEVPRTAPGTTINVQAEATTQRGKTLRASAILRLERTHGES